LIKDKFIKATDSQSFNWLDTIPLIAERGIVINYTPRWPLFIQFMGTMVCFGLSTFYHTFNSHSKAWMNYFIRLDYAGICIGIAAASTPMIYYAFECPEMIEF
jgi:predicted membrane channel-forming protein YqfA (hemolysin III family)